MKKSPKFTVCFTTHLSSWIWFCLIEGQRGHPYVLDATALIGNSFLRLEITSRWETHIHLHKWLWGFTLTRIHLCKTYSFSLFIWINKCLNLSTNEANNLSNISHILPSPLTFTSDLWFLFLPWKKHRKQSMFRTVYLHNQSCVLLEEPLLPVLYRGHKKIHTWDIYICASRFIYFRLAQFEETNGVLHYRTIIKHSLFLSWEEHVWVNVSHTYNHLSSASRGKQWGETCECCKSLLCQHHVSYSFIINI